MQEAVAVTTAIQEEIFLEMGIGNLVLLASMLNSVSTFVLWHNDQIQSSKNDGM